jgi:hypothetical protein
MGGTLDHVSSGSGGAIASYPPWRRCSGCLWSPMSAFGVKVGRYLKRGRLKRNVRCRRHLLDDASLGLISSFSSLADFSRRAVRRCMPS